MGDFARLNFVAKFRDYQRRAIAMTRAYRRDFVAKKTKGAALVCHPTGTGKTAIIAGLAQCTEEIGSVIVLTTREAIRDQLARELSANLWLDAEKFGLKQTIELNKAIYVLKSGSDARALARDVRIETQKLLGVRYADFTERQFNRLTNGRPGSLVQEFVKKRAVLVMTVQMLNAIMGSDVKLYEAFASSVSLIVFDEGHYEPAAKWSKAVRGLNAPIALFSATPFRNDLRPFQIEERNISIYKYDQAWRAGHIRQVEARPRQRIDGAEAFCQDIIDFCAGEFGRSRSKWPRILIHCDQRTRIVELGEAFVRQGLSVVAIHDRFDPKPKVSWQFKDVPSPRETEGQVWIHQYKLMEGIDDHRFRVLAFYDPMKNVRSIVQQIGRVIRRGKDEANEKALVLDHYGGRIRQYWELYERYDQSLSPEYLIKTLSRFYLDAYANIHPKVDYVNGKFRQPLVLAELQGVLDEILFERSVSFKEISASDKLDDFTSLLEADFATNDVDFVQSYMDERSAIYVYATVGSPEFLNTRFFIEPRHGARLLYMVPGKKLLAIANAGASPGPGDALSALEPLSPRRLECVLTPGKHGRVNALSSQNTSLGNRVVRRRTISAPSIALTPPILDEHGHVLSTITGYNGDRPRVVDELDYVEVDVGLAATASTVAKKKPGAKAEVSLIRRYVGLAKGRVSEVGDPLRFRAFQEWIGSLVDQMEEGKRASDVLRRYAKVAETEITDPAAKNLLLDIVDVQDLYTNRKTNEEIQSDELCLARKGEPEFHADRIVSHFDVTLNGDEYPIEIAYYEKSGRYRIESSALDDAFKDKSDPRHLPLTRALNDRQAFNIVPNDITVIYVHGRFYAPGMKFGSRFSKESFFAGNCLYPSEVLRELDTEKGRFVVMQNGKRGKLGGGFYDPGSVFSLIDNWRDGFDTSDLKLCPKWVAQYRPEPVKFVPTLVVCDDMNKETADFFLVDELERRVVIVHAKATPTWKPFSASAVQEVCAQAQKNTSLFSMFSLQKPGNLSRWNSHHTFTGTEKVKLSVMKRVRKPENLTGSVAWERLRPLLQNPLTTKEVWLVLGNMLSANQFAESLQTDEPDPETLQLNHLLQTTIAAVGSVGAKTRIFCSP